MAEHAEKQQKAQKVPVQEPHEEFAISDAYYATRGSASKHALAAAIAMPSCKTLTPMVVQRLQQTHGNAFVQRLITRAGDMKSPTVIQRCACGGEAEKGGECAACKARRLSLQRASDEFAETNQITFAHNTGLQWIARQVIPIQQKTGGPSIQRDEAEDFLAARGCHDTIDRIRAIAAYKALNPGDKKLTEEIITETQKKQSKVVSGTKIDIPVRSLPDQLHILGKLEQLFNTPEKDPKAISAATQASTEAAATTEKERVAKPAEAQNTDLEENAAKDPKRNGKWTPIKGKFGGGTYYVDRTSPTDIVVRAKIFLRVAGTGKKKDIDNIKSMEDGIEKAASTKGYLVNIEFVNIIDSDTFTVDVDPSQWEVATNWSGGNPVGFAHELHHMFAFELDRYNYIESHSTNESMKVNDRLHWFREELKKPPGYNDPTSIMNNAAHPNDSDACIVTGLDEKTCVNARQKAATP